jgi:hypothetical protein
VRRGEGRLILTIASRINLPEPHNIVVEISNPVKAEGLKIFVTHLILQRLIGSGMTVAIYFNDERLF